MMYHNPEPIAQCDLKNNRFPEHRILTVVAVELVRVW